VRILRKLYRLPKSLNPDEAFQQLIFVHEKIRDSGWNADEIIDSLIKLIDVLICSGYRRTPERLAELLGEFSRTKIDRIELAASLRLLRREIVSEKAFKTGQTGGSVNDEVGWTEREGLHKAS